MRRPFDLISDNTTYLVWCDSNNFEEEDKIKSGKTTSENKCNYYLLLNKKVCLIKGQREG